jgi:hypothetical protein
MHGLHQKPTTKLLYTIFTNLSKFSGAGRGAGVEFFNAVRLAFSAIFGYNNRSSHPQILPIVADVIVGGGGRFAAPLSTPFWTDFPTLD